MDIWIICDGEKTGPIHDFEVRRKIEAGELPASTPAWHEGLATWKPLIEIDLFTREFKSATDSPQPPPIPQETPQSTDPSTPPQATYYQRRFWARWLDLSLYSAIWWLGMWAARQNIEAALLNPWIMFLQYVPWFALEAVLIHQFATTPGKWLLGLRVVNKDHSLLDLAAAIRRSLRVLFTGIGFGWSVLALFCQALSLFTARRLGTTLWDYTGGHQVTAEPVNPFRLLSLVFLFSAVIQLHVLVLSPIAYEITVERQPGFKERYEKNPFWHLPQRY